MIHSYPHPHRTEPRDLVGPQAVVLAGISLVLLVTAVVSGTPGVFVAAALAALGAGLSVTVTTISDIAAQPEPAGAERASAHL